ncbi:MAG: hypothetical protein IIA92_03855 [Chloroflexi bacterium]|nr:hypothetical protein [Chloroflexota bacterium]
MKLIRHKGASTTKFIGLLVPLLLMVLIACTLTEDQLIEGILQNVDSVNGEITIVTKDGKTITLTIATDAPVATEGASSALETLEPGTTLEVEVDDDGQVAVRIKARQAKLQGRIVEIAGNEVTIESPLGRKATVLVTENTRIELEDDFPGALSDLRVGSEVEVKFDPESRVAFKIDSDEEEAEIDGVVLEIAGSEVTVETERGRILTLIVGERTRFELEHDIPGTLADLQVGATIEAKFDPFTRDALEIEIEEQHEESNEEEIEGVIVGIEGNEITVETESGRILTFTVADQTRIELDDDFKGTLSDLRVGLQIDIRVNTETNVALEVEVED